MNKISIRFCLPDATLAEIESLCFDATALFPGLEVCGMDILLRRHTLEPYVIEMNAQGDLIYQDIFNENRVYIEQVLHMNKRKHESGANVPPGERR